MQCHNLLGAHLQYTDVQATNSYTIERGRGRITNFTISPSEDTLLCSTDTNQVAHLYTQILRSYMHKIYIACTQCALATLRFICWGWGTPK